LLIFLILSPLIEKAIVEESTEEAYNVADYLGDHLALSPDKLAPGARDAFVVSEIRYIKDSFNLYEICILAEDGRTAYSTGDTLEGRKLSPEILDGVLHKGKRTASFSRRGGTTQEGNVSATSMVKAYVPVKLKGQVIGAIGVHYDISSLHGDISRIKTFFALMLFVLSFSVLVLISYYLVRAERIEQLRAKAEGELVQEQIKAETVFSSMGDNIIIQNRDYKVIYQNALNREIYGDRKGEYCYKVYEGLDHVCPDCPVELTYMDGAIHKTEKVVDTPKGQMNFELTATPLRNPAGEIIAGIKVVRDISDRRRLEDQLRHAQKMEAIGTLTSGISHEFNNLLTSIIGFSELLLETAGGGTEERRYLEAIYNSGRKAESLTRGLLAYSRKQITDRTPVSLNSIIRDLMSLVDNITGVDIRVNLELSNEDLVITADRNQIEQVLVNIITNARDAMPEGGELSIATAPITLDSGFVREHGFGNEGERFCLVSIKDTGTGMDPLTMERVFEPFYTTKDVGKGTGLGLSIAFGIVSQHGGYMDVMSTQGKGTEFRIYLAL